MPADVPTILMIAALTAEILPALVRTHGAITFRCLIELEPDIANVLGDPSGEIGKAADVFSAQYAAGVTQINEVLNLLGLPSQNLESPIQNAALAIPRNVTTLVDGLSAIGRQTPPNTGITELRYVAGQLADIGLNLAYWPPQLTTYLQHANQNGDLSVQSVNGNPLYGNALTSAVRTFPVIGNDWATITATFIKELEGLDRSPTGSLDDLKRLLGDTGPTDGRQM